jgi:hypothetical protein
LMIWYHEAWTVLTENEIGIWESDDGGILTLVWNWNELTAAWKQWVQLGFVFGGIFIRT